MSDPGEIQFACIGCGALNPIGAEVCSGCDHRFAGPDGGPILRTESGPVSIPPAYERRLLDDAPRRPRSPAPETSDQSPIVLFQAAEAVQGVGYLIFVLVILVRSGYRAYANAGGILGAPIASIIVALGGFGIVIGALYLIGNSVEESENESRRGESNGTRSRSRVMKR